MWERSRPSSSSAWRWASLSRRKRGTLLKTFGGDPVQNHLIYAFVTFNLVGLLMRLHMSLYMSLITWYANLHNHISSYQYVYSIYTYYVYTLRCRAQVWVHYIVVSGYGIACRKSHGLDVTLRVCVR